MSLKNLSVPKDNILCYLSLMICYNVIKCHFQPSGNESLWMGYCIDQDG